MVAKGFTTEGTTVPEKLLAGDYPRVGRKVTIGIAADLVAGTVLGKITASGKYIQSLSAAVDGSQVPEAILAEDAAAAAAEVEALIYETGDFNEAALTLGAAHTIASIRQGLRERGIFLHTVTE